MMEYNYYHFNIILGFAIILGAFFLFTNEFLAKLNAILGGMNLGLGFTAWVFEKDLDEK